MSIKIVLFDCYICILLLKTSLTIGILAKLPYAEIYVKPLLLLPLR